MSRIWEELNFSDTGFSTADGRRRFPTVDGVPNFLAYPSIEDGEQVQTLISAERGGSHERLGAVIAGRVWEVVEHISICH